ncbi:MAG: MaoC/PaaZ C-terminal domain-containing protein [Pseudomonadota bacterium]
MTSTLERPPSALSLYLKAAGSARRKPGKNIEIPLLETRLENVRANAEQLAAYNKVCGFKDAETLPITFPQVMAFSLPMYLMAQPEFPLPMLGIVHVRNSIRQTRPLRADETYSVAARITESRRVRAGLEFDLVTEYSLDGEILYTSLMTAIYRISEGKGGGGAKPKAQAPVQQLTEYRSFDVPADMGRRYAAAGKDYNPIHLTAFSAKLFGFKRAIAHGMWSLAHCAALLQEAGAPEPKELLVQFKQPLFLPGKVAMKFQKNGDAYDFALIARSADKMHLSGSLS